MQEKHIRFTTMLNLISLAVKRLLLRMASYLQIKKVNLIRVIGLELFVNLRIMQARLLISRLVSPLLVQQRLNKIYVMKFLIGIFKR